MNEPFRTLLVTAIAIAVAFGISFASTPLVNMFAKVVGAVDIPKDERRMHTKPVTRLGGLAIFLGFLLCVLLFADINRQLQGILLGSVVIVIIGVLDDIMNLRWWIKFIFQFLAAFIPVWHGVVIDVISNPNIFSGSPYLSLGMWSIPVTVIWIVAITNSVNFIDGLDGLAVGVSGIASFCLLVIALMYSEINVALVLAALTGACLGFMPYNRNPAKMFMGDTGATFLGYILACVSVLGLFKFYAVISFAVPFLILGLPIFDTILAVFRRLLKGKSPMHPDRSHVHHRLIDMGFSQKQSVAILYTMSIILGLAAVMLASSGAVRAILFLAAVIVALVFGFRIFGGFNGKAAKNNSGNTPDESDNHTPPDHPAQ